MVLVFHAKEAKAKTSKDGGRSERELVSEERGVRKFFIHLESLRPGAGPTGYHYHKAKETVLFVLRGRGRLLLEGAEYEVGPYQVIVIRPGERHGILEVLGEEEFEFLEIGAPPVEDRVPVGP
ncbi:MAG: cupin domain-containing protein [Candidatus Bathyarchaeia archaeon]